LSIVDFSVPNLNGLTVFRAFRLVICVFSWEIEKNPSTIFLYNF
jgi:hypothetical protein